MTYNELITYQRKKTYKTAKEFYNKKKPPCTYYYYSFIEKGRLPDVALAISLIKALGIDLRLGLFTYVQTLMPTTETKAIFHNLYSPLKPKPDQISSEEAITINRKHLEILENDPTYWELLLFLSTRKANINDIAGEFKQPVTKIKKSVKDLYDYGLLNKTENSEYYGYPWFFVPDSAEFKPLREKNFKRCVQQFFKQDLKNTYCATVTHQLTKEQLEIVKSLTISFINTIVDLPEEGASDSVPYTVGVFSSVRKFGDA